MTKKPIRIGCAGLILCTWFCITSTVIWWNYVPYLAQFETTAELKTHVLSVVILDTSTLQDVQQLIETQTFGEMSCFFLDVNGRVAPIGDSLFCDGSMERFGWWRYYIVFQFEDGILRSVEVGKYYRGL